jgi:two-component system phosphate regulon sensor histidine kinase PhoR
LKSIRTKFITLFIIVILLFTILIILYSYQRIKENYTQTLTTNLKYLNISLIELLKPLLINNNIDSLVLKVNNLGEQTNTRITIIDTLGVVLADSKRDPKTMENHLQRQEIHDVLIKKKTISILRYSTTLQKEMLYVAMPISDYNKNLIAVSRVAIFLSDIDNLNYLIFRDIIKITLFILIITISLIIIIASNITKPIKELTKASRKIALGDFDINIITKTNDEIRELGIYFNQMTYKLKKLFNELIAQKKSYTALISSIMEGILVINFKGEILLTNKAFNDIFNISGIEGKEYKEVLKINEIKEIIDEVILYKKIIKKEISFNNRTYLISSNLTKSNNEIIFIIYDFTDLSNINQLKKDFIVNVSHELRTPLTAIKGYIETIEDDVEGETLKYVEIIRKHTDRLINIVQDLLTLSELENATNTIQLSKTDINIILYNVTKLLEPKAKEKNIKLICQVEEGFPKVKIDPFKMEQVFINLIDNSIKYTSSGFVKVDIFQRDEFAYFEISDTGSGIPKEHHSRIFERFYTIDKSRSRKVGGTGLGLSIVKHIILLHNGEIFIDSNYTNGTKFVIKLPLKISNK